MTLHDVLLIGVGGSLGLVAANAFALWRARARLTEALDVLLDGLDNVEDRIAEAEVELARLEDRQAGLSSTLAFTQHTQIERVVREVLTRRIE